MRMRGGSEEDLNEETTKHTCHTARRRRDQVALVEERGESKRNRVPGEPRRTYLQRRLLHGHLAEDASAVVGAHRLQLVLVEREELRPRQHPQTPHGAACEPSAAVRPVWAGATEARGARGGSHLHGTESLGLQPAPHVVGRRLVRDADAGKVGGAAAQAHARALAGAATQRQALQELVPDLLHGGPPA